MHNCASGHSFYIFIHPSDTPPSALSLPSFVFHGYKDEPCNVADVGNPRAAMTLRCVSDLAIPTQRHEGRPGTHTYTLELLPGQRFRGVPDARRNTDNEVPEPIQILITRTRAQRVAIEIYWKFLIGNYFYTLNFLASSDSLVRLFLAMAILQESIFRHPLF